MPRPPADTPAAPGNPLAVPVVPEAMPQKPVVVPPRSLATPAESCRHQFGEELAQGGIIFDTDKDVFRQISYATLDRLAEIAKSCPGQAVEIAVHTAADGTPDYDRDLSQRRANAILAYLKTKVEIGRYTAKGFGDQKPLASNATEDGRRRNRRVEFVLK